jgi:nucleotide-binding universal stress UspA family protein
MKGETSTVVGEARARAEAQPPFERIVCAVDGSWNGRHAVDQAIAISEPGTALLFVCVRSETGTGPTHRANIGAERASAALAEAKQCAGQAGVKAAGEILPGEIPAEVLLDEASRADLLVVPSHVASRVGGILLGTTEATAVHRACVPVLVARRPPDDAAFPKRIVVASDGSPDARRAEQLAGRLARRHDAAITVVTVDTGDAAEEILRVGAHASLIVVGSRGLSGVRALGSVSERVASRAPCSVLVVRPEWTPPTGSGAK